MLMLNDDDVEWVTPITNSVGWWTLHTWWQYVHAIQIRIIRCAIKNRTIAMHIMRANSIMDEIYHQMVCAKF